MIKKLSKDLLKRLAKAPEETARRWYETLTPEEKTEARRLLEALHLKINI